MRKIIFIVCVMMLIVQAHAKTCNIGEYLNNDECTPIPNGYQCSEYISDVPDEYTQLQQITSSGKEYIDTGYIPNNNTEIYVKYKLIRTDLSYGLTGNVAQAVFGNYVNNNTNVTRIIQHDSASISYVSNNTMAGENINVPIKNTIDVYEDYLGNGIYISNGTQYELSTTPGNDNNTSIALFAHNTDGQSPGSSTIYYVHIMENGITVHNFIPAKRNSDNVAGMYDTVTETFHTSIGSGDFTTYNTQSPTCTAISRCPSEQVCITGTFVSCAAGYYLDNNTCVQIAPGYYGSNCPVQVQLSDTYTQLNYLESTGTQFINTGYVANDSTEVYIKYEWTTIPNNWSTVFGNYDSRTGSYGYEDYNVTRILANGSQAYVYLNNRANSGSSRPAFQVNQIYEDYLSKKLYTSNGKRYTVRNTVGKNNPIPIALFASGPYDTRTSTTKIYYARFIDNGNVVRDFVPVIRNSDNTVGMYDIVNDVFYTNIGTGNFLYTIAVCSGQTLCDSGHYCTNGIRHNCTNAPTNSTYTATGWTTAQCPWVCNANYLQTDANMCRELCTAGATTLRTGTGVNVPLFSSRNTTPAINIEFNNTVCYADLLPGIATNAINIEYNGQIYHTVR